MIKSIIIISLPALAFIIGMFYIFIERNKLNEKHRVFEIKMPHGNIVYKIVEIDNLKYYSYYLGNGQWSIGPEVKTKTNIQ